MKVNLTDAQIKDMDEYVSARIKEWDLDKKHREQMRVVLKKNYVRNLNEPRN